MEHTWIRVNNWKDIPKDVIGIYRIACPCKYVYIGMSEKSIYGRWRSYSKPIGSPQPDLYRELRKHNNFNLWLLEYLELPADKIMETERVYIEHYNKITTLLNMIGGNAVEFKLFNTITKEIMVIKGANEVYDFFKGYQRFPKPSPYRSAYNVYNDLPCTIEYHNSIWRVLDEDHKIIKPLDEQMDEYVARDEDDKLDFNF